MLTSAYYEAEISDFLQTSTEAIVGRIAFKHSQSIEHLLTNSWRSEIRILQAALQSIGSGHILFEMQIPRMGRRADVVLVVRDVIFVLEFKAGATTYMAEDLRQCHGYALDLKHFHDGSHDKKIVPILIATEAPNKASPLRAFCDLVAEPICANSKNIGAIISKCLDLFAGPVPIDYQVWYHSAYRPSPTIVEAAQALYAAHEVDDIARNDAGAQNLHSTSGAVAGIILDAQTRSRKAICFITGVPGSGKTLVGLNIAALNSRANAEPSVFLSGNGPLVEVLTEALARDSVCRDRTKTKDSQRRNVAAHIQNIHRFRDDSLVNPSKPPAERIVIFDEAQRAWDKAHTSRFMVQKRGQIGFDQSEPEFLIGVMNRHVGWCVIVALIGGGQEINTGEAGLQGWVDAISEKYPKWDVHFSDKLMQVEYAGKDVSFQTVPGAKQLASLHLGTSMRSFRAEKHSHMIHHLIHNDAKAANALYQTFKKKFPMKITRDLGIAKSWVRANARANETKGLIASSGGIRLKAEGIFVKNKLTSSDWFLNESDDVRSCHFLEDVATEFDIQGLELDWCLLAWDADLRYQSGAFEHWQFRGAKWMRRQQPEQKRFLENAYRVLLTRARQGLVVFVPRGDDADSTRQPSQFDETYSFLLTCGLEELSLDIGEDALLTDGRQPAQIIE